MWAQLNNWTCSICAVSWVLQSIGIIDPLLDQYYVRREVTDIIGYPNCVNETYGAMSAQCLIDAFAHYGLKSSQAWVGFDEAYAIMEQTTGLINPTGMYHYMAIRGISGSSLWVANSAQGYLGVYDTMTRSQFNNLGPVQLIYCSP